MIAIIHCHTLGLLCFSLQLQYCSSGIRPYMFSLLLSQAESSQINGRQAAGATLASTIP